MSVVVRLPDNNIWLYCKGADNVILELSVPEADPVMKQHLDNTMSNFAKARRPPHAGEGAGCDFETNQGRGHRPSCLDGVHSSGCAPCSWLAGSCRRTSTPSLPRSTRTPRPASTTARRRCHASASEIIQTRGQVDDGANS